MFVPSGRRALLAQNAVQPQLGRKRAWQEVLLVDGGEHLGCRGCSRCGQSPIGRRLLAWPMLSKAKEWTTPLFGKAVIRQSGYNVWMKLVQSRKRVDTRDIRGTFEEYMGSERRIIESGRRKSHWPPIASVLASPDISGHLSNVIEVEAALRETRS